MDLESEPQSLDASQFSTTYESDLGLGFKTSDLSFKTVIKITAFGQKCWCLCTSACCVNVAIDTKTAVTRLQAY